MNSPKQQPRKSNENMEMINMLERLSKIIENFTGKKDICLSEETVLTTDLGLTSFDLIQLVVGVEDEFDIEISDRAIKNFKTAGDVINYIEKQ